MGSARAPSALVATFVAIFLASPTSAHTVLSSSETVDVYAYCYVVDYRIGNIIIRDDVGSRQKYFGEPTTNEITTHAGHLIYNMYLLRKDAAILQGNVATWTAIVQGSSVNYELDIKTGKILARNDRREIIGGNCRIPPARWPQS